ncbi:MAG: hypothetical protein HYY50_05235 [Candidatus Kerfeldbacteria bacterium]|nr:hypothetical protein [Candidatus Kerfeldbacteria bacterium]
MKLVEQSISKDELLALAKERFGDMVKAVVDIERGVMVVGGELHADAEQRLLEHGSNQTDLWGINIYPEKPRAEWIEFDSMINIRPSQGNRSRSVEDEGIRRRIIGIVNRLTP